ncbi:MAG TPA: AzlD domain-containing protein [Anaerolineales bacterium]
MRVWLIFIAAGLITYLIRLSFIYLFGRMKMPPLLERALRYVPPAVLTAIILPELVLHSGRLDLSLTNVRLLAGLLAALVAWRTKNILLTLAAGMAALWILQFVLKP